MTKTFILKSTIYTEESYPHALFIQTKVKANNESEAFEKFYNQITSKLEKVVSTETTAKEVE